MTAEPPAPAREREAQAQAANPSASALAYQAFELEAQLSRFREHHYPEAARRIATILQLLTAKARERLHEISNRAAEILRTDEVTDVQTLGKIVHLLHSYVRYLHASDPALSPPGIQRAISTLVERYVPIALTRPQSDVAVLVRPQWSYNLKFVDLIEQFSRHIDVSDFDKMLPASIPDMKALIENLWNANGEKDAPPRSVAILSFAGLDKEDVLLYPLLAHELGHFIDFEYPDTIHDNPRVIGNDILPTGEELERLVDKYRPSPGVLWEDVRREHVRRLRTEIDDGILICLREITADLLAARMVGVPFFVALVEFLKTMHEWPGRTVDPLSGYPGFAYRARLVWSELLGDPDGVSTLPELERHLTSSAVPGSDAVSAYLKSWSARISGHLPAPAAPKSPDEEAVLLIEARVAKALPRLQSLIREVIPAEKAAVLPAHVGEMVQLLATGIPPFQRATRGERAACDFVGSTFSDILAAGWLYQIAIGDADERLPNRCEDRAKIYRRTCMLLFKALELEEARDAIAAINAANEIKPIVNKPIADESTSEARTGAIGGPALRSALDDKELSRRLLVCPDYGDDPIESASWDMHLGNWFRVAIRTSLPAIDIAYHKERARVRTFGQQELYIPYGRTFVLQPGDFALAISLEFISVPSDMMAFVEGKSSLGRAGLLIATATQVAPGFRGCVVLELYNSGTIPIQLRPAMRIAQLVFIGTGTPLTQEWTYQGGHICQVKP